MARDPVLDIKWLTVAEIAAMARVSKMTVYRLVNSGELPSMRFGRDFRVAEDDVATFLRARMSAGA